MITSVVLFAISHHLIQKKANLFPLMIPSVESLVDLTDTDTDTELVLLRQNKFRGTERSMNES